MARLEPVAVYALAATPAEASTCANSVEAMPRKTPVSVPSSAERRSPASYSAE